MPYLMVSDHPYYPCVEYFSTKDEAEAAALVERENKEDKEGEYNCIITVAEILTTITVNSCY